MENNTKNSDAENITEKIISNIFEDEEFKESNKGIPDAVQNFVKELVTLEVKERVEDIISDNDESNNFERSFDEQENLEGCLKYALVVILCFLVFVGISYLAFNA